MEYPIIKNIVTNELDVQVSTAKTYPRDIKKAMNDAIDLATSDEDAAASCSYCLVRKNKKTGESTEIVGPSTRLAEILVYTWGNVHAGARVIEDDGNFITAEAVAWDLERNIKISSQVKMPVTGASSTGGRYRFSDDLVALKGSAAMATAYRNAVFKLIPKAVYQPVYDAAKKLALGSDKSLVDRVNNALVAFGKLGVNEKSILALLNKQSVDQIQLADLEKLRGVMTAINEGITTVKEVFSDPKESNLDAVKEKILKSKNMRGE